MTLFAIGDIQGCNGEFAELLDAIAFDSGKDELWLVGDLINRGPSSLDVLREVINLGDSATVVLGNHDLHLLATAAGVRPPAPGDTFQDVLAAPDAANIIDWLRDRPLLHHDVQRGRILVHAGVPPAWSIGDALARAAEVEANLRGPGWVAALREMYGNEPRSWSDRTEGSARARFIINALTRMRYCDEEGNLDFEFTGPPGSQPEHLTPWFDHRDRKSADTHIVFGHWASLGLLRRSDITALDSGCVWGGALTALPIDPPGEPFAIDCEGASRAQRGS